MLSTIVVLLAGGIALFVTWLSKPKDKLALIVWGVAIAAVIGLFIKFAQMLSKV